MGDGGGNPADRHIGDAELGGLTRRALLKRGRTDAGTDECDEGANLGIHWVLRSSWSWLLLWSPKLDVALDGSADVFSRLPSASPRDVELQAGKCAFFERERAAGHELVLAGL